MSALQDARASMKSSMTKAASRCVALAGGRKGPSLGNNSDRGIAGGGTVTARVCTWGLWQAVKLIAKHGSKRAIGVHGRIAYCLSSGV